MNSRIEAKYLVPPEIETALQHDIGAMCRLDAHSRSKSRQYGIRSLYFDSPSRISYFEKVDGVAQRLKFRVRHYAASPGEPNLEIKERHSNRILKRKVRLDADQLAAIESRVGLSAAYDDPVLAEFAYYRSLYALEPIILIDYARRAYFARSDVRTRITFDSKITATRGRRLGGATAAPVKVFHSGHSVLEIKFDERLPGWLHGLIRKYSLQDMAISKYCLGYDALVAAGKLPPI